MGPDEGGGQLYIDELLVMAEELHPTLSGLSLLVLGGLVPGRHELGKK
jgi:hypothetical protein